MKKDVVVLGVGRALQMLLLFANYRLLTTILPKHEVGQYFFILSLTAIVGLIFINPLGTWFHRTLHSFENSLQVRTQMLLAFFSILLLAFLNFPVLWALSSLFESLGSEWLMVAGVVTFYVAATSINNTLIPVFNFFKQRELFVVLTVLSQGLALFWAWSFGIKTEKASMWMLGHSVGFAILACLALVFPVRVEKPSNVKALSMPLLSRSAWSFAWPVAVVNVAVWVMTQGYRPFLEKVAGLEVLAEVGLGLGLASALAVAFEYLVQQIYQPDFYKATHSDSESAWISLAVKSFAHYIHFWLFLVLIAPFAIHLMADSKFQNAAIYLQLGAVVELFRMTTNLIALKAHGDLKTGRLRKPYLSAAVVLMTGLGVLTTVSFRGWVVVAVLLASYVVLSVLVARANAVSFWPIFKFGNHDDKLAMVAMMPILIVPTVWADTLWINLLVCAAAGGVFLWGQYRKVLRFEGREVGL